MAATKDDNITFEMVRLNGGILTGSLTLTNEDIALTETLEEGDKEDDSQTTTTSSTTNTNPHKLESSWQWRWPLDCIQENLVIKPVSCTVELTFIENSDTAPTSAALPEGEDSVSFRFANINDLMLFRKAMTSKLRKKRKSKASRSSTHNRTTSDGRPENSKRESQRTMAARSCDSSINTGTSFVESINVPTVTTSLGTNNNNQGLQQTTTQGRSSSSIRSTTGLRTTPFQLPKDNLFSSSSSITSSIATNNNNLQGRTQSGNSVSSLGTSLTMGSGGISFNPGVRGKPLSTTSSTTKKRKMQKGDNDRTNNLQANEAQQHPNHFPELAPIAAFGLVPSQSQEIRRLPPAAAVAAAPPTAPPDAWHESTTSMPQLLPHPSGSTVATYGTAASGVAAPGRMNYGRGPVYTGVNSLPANQIPSAADLGYGDRPNSSTIPLSSSSPSMGYNKNMPSGSISVSSSTPSVGYNDHVGASYGYNSNNNRHNYGTSMSNNNNYYAQGGNATWEASRPPHGNVRSEFGSPRQVPYPHNDPHDRGRPRYRSDFDSNGGQQRAPYDDYDRHGGPHHHHAHDDRNNNGWDRHSYHSVGHNQQHRGYGDVPGNGKGGPAADSVRREFTPSPPFDGDQRPVIPQSTRSFSPGPTSRSLGFDPRRDHHQNNSYHQRETSRPNDNNSRMHKSLSSLRENSMSESSSHNDNKKPLYPSVASRHTDRAPSPSESSDISSVANARKPLYPSVASLASVESNKVESSIYPPKYLSDRSAESNAYSSQSASDSSSYISKPKSRQTPNTPYLSKLGPSPPPSPSSESSQQDTASPVPTPAPAPAPGPSPGSMASRMQRLSMLRRVQSFRHSQQEKIDKMMVLNRENSSRSLQSQDRRESSRSLQSQERRDSCGSTSAAAITAPPTAVRRTSINNSSVTRPIVSTSKRISDPTSTASFRARSNRSLSPCRQRRTTQRTLSDKQVKTSSGLSDNFRHSDTALSKRTSVMENFHSYDRSVSRSRSPVRKHDNLRHSDTSISSRQQSAPRSPSPIRKSDNLRHSDTSISSQKQSAPRSRSPIRKTDNLRHSDTSISSRTTAAKNLRKSDTSPSKVNRSPSTKRTAAEKFREFDASKTSDENSDSSTSDRKTSHGNLNNTVTSKKNSTPRPGAAIPRKKSDQNLLNTVTSETNSKPRVGTPRRSSIAGSTAATWSSGKAAAAPPTTGSRLSAAKLAAFHNRRNKLSGSSGPDIDDARNKMRRTTSESDMKRATAANEDAIQSKFRSERGAGRVSDEKSSFGHVPATRPGVVHVKNSDNAKEKSLADKERDFNNVPTSNPGGQQKSSSVLRKDMEGFGNTRNSLRGRETSKQGGLKGVLKNSDDKYNDNEDSDDTALQSVRNALDLKARLKREMASLGKTIGRDSDSSGIDDSYDYDDSMPDTTDVSEPKMRLSVSNRRDRWATNSMQGTGKDNNSTSRPMQKNLHGESDDSRESYDSESEESDDSHDSMPDSTDTSDAKERLPPSSAKDRGRSRVEERQNNATGKQKRGRRRIMRKASSERDLENMKPPSLVQKQMARSQSSRSLKKLPTISVDRCAGHDNSAHRRSNSYDPRNVPLEDGAEDNEGELREDTRDDWKQSLQRRKSKLSAKFEMPTKEDKRKILARSKSAHNMARPEFDKQESFASARSQRSAGDDESAATPDDSVWKPSKSSRASISLPATRPGVQYVVGNPEADTREMLKIRQSTVRQDLANLGLQKAGSNKSLASSIASTTTRSLSNRSMGLLEDLGLVDGDATVTSAVSDQQSRVSDRPSDEKAAERPAERAIVPGAQQVKTPLISHSMAKQDMATLGSEVSGRTRTASPGPAFANRSSDDYGEESKEEITDDPDKDYGDSVVGARSLMNDGISMKEFQMRLATAPSSSKAASVTSAASDDNDRATIERRKAASGDVENGTIDLAAMELTASLIEASLVDDAAEGIVSAEFVDPEAENRRRRKVYALVTVGCGCLALVVTLLTAFLRPESKAPDEPPPPLTPEERYELFHQHFEGIVHDSSLFQDPMSPQYRALEWISMIDTTYENPLELDSTELEKMHQRYYLAAIYYSMTYGKPWGKCGQPETGEESPCVYTVTDSYGVEGVYYQQKEKEPTFRWLSNVDECSWAGVLCEDGRLTSHLRLGATQLMGTLAVEVAELRSLQLLDLHDNNIGGTLPAAWGELGKAGSNLVSLRLDSNQFSGTIPDSWCQMNQTSLTEMILANNDLTGTLPACLEKLRAMEDFSVKDNKMTGTIPNELGELFDLQTIHMSGNNFTGAFPEQLCWLESRHLYEASTDCLNILSDSYVQCPCCTKCCDGGEETCRSTEDYRG